MVKNKFKSSRSLFFILLFLVLHLSAAGGFYITQATVRYVSHSGSNTPPYTTWETAADSIMFAINISVFGDTIYVANGVYEEQIVMIPGLKLIGAGMDSCVIDTRNIAEPIGVESVTVKDSSLFKGFQVIAGHSTIVKAIKSDTVSAVIEYNKLKSSVWGILAFSSNSIVKDNIFQNFTRGISLKNSSLHIQNNHFTNVDRGIDIDAFTGDYYPVIENNIISANSFGILVQFNSKPMIRNNTIILNGDFADGYTGGGADTAWLYNNLVIANGSLPNAWGFANSTKPTIEYNNLIIGDMESGIRAWDNNQIRNNVILNSREGIHNRDNGSNLSIQYNDAWNNEVNYKNFTPDSTNLAVDPMIVNEDTTKGKLDFHLQMFSPLIDAGDPNIFDRDGSRSDIGLYGGPYGWSYTYQDLAPRPPHNVTAVIEDGLVKLTWNKNTEADFSHYRIYRDTVSIIIYDSTKIIGETTDTVFYDNLPPVNRETSFYYVITAFDNQGNQSYPSEEINVTVTGLSEHPPKGYDDYRLLSNYPNPFNPSTIIPYRLKEGGYVKLYIYDIKGELVTTLVNQWQEKGYYEVTFQPSVRDRQRANSFEVPMGKTYSDIATGVYIYMIQVKSDNNIPVFSDMGKMILLK